MQTTAARSGLIAEMQPDAVSAELLHKLPATTRSMRDRPPMSHFAATFPLSDFNRNRCLANIQRDDSASLHPASPPFLKSGASQLGATVERRMPRERPPSQSPQTASIEWKNLDKCVSFIHDTRRWFRQTKEEACGIFLFLSSLSLRSPLYPLGREM